MKSISKNLYLILAAACAIALIVFLIQLIIINSGNDPQLPSAVAAADDDGYEDATVNPFDDYTPDVTTRPIPEGTRYDISVDTDTVLTIYADDEKFDYIVDDLEWRFDYKSGSNIALVIDYIRLTDRGASVEGEMYLNNRMGDTIAGYVGMQQILESDMSGYIIRATRDGMTHETFIYRLPGNTEDLALAFTINYEFNGQRDDLYALINSITVEREQG